MDSDANDVSRHFRPGKGDFTRILDKLKTYTLGHTMDVPNSRPSFDQGHETKHEKRQRLQQEAMQRDQYLLSMRPNRHVVFAAKFAKVKNQGLTQQFDTQVHIWSQELRRNCGLVRAGQREAARELIRMRKTEKCLTLPSLSESSPNKELLYSRRRHQAKRYNQKLPRLERKNLKDAGYRRGVSSNGDGSDETGKNKTTSSIVKLPPVQPLKKE